MAKTKTKSKTRGSIRRDNKNTQGIIGVILSIIGVLSAFQYGTDNLPLYFLFLFMVIGGIYLVAKSLSD